MSDGNTDSAGKFSDEKKEAKFTAEKINEGVNKTYKTLMLGAEVNAIKQLGDIMGYGHMMSIASALWRKKLKETGVPESGAFIPTIIQFLKKEEQKIAEKESKHYDQIIENNI